MTDRICLSKKTNRERSSMTGGRRKLPLGHIKEFTSATTLRSAAMAASLALTLQLSLPPGALSATSGTDSPSGTLLLPLTPKLDTTPSTASDTAKKADEETGDIKTVAPQESNDGPPLLPNSVLKTAPDKFSVEVDVEDEDPAMAESINEDTTLKGTIQIVADDTEFDQEKNTFLGTGNAVAIIGGQNSKLEADMILYDQNNEEIDARGNVRITRDGQVTVGSAFKFKVNKDEYLITNPDTEINGATVVARKGYGTDEGIAFRKGSLTMPDPIYIQRNTMIGPIGYSAEVQQKMIHPDAYVPVKPSVKFKARKMVYEKYKTDGGNLTVFGGKLQMGSFDIPVPRFSANISKNENTVVFPISPSITNNLQIGGMHIGPKFNHAMGKKGILSWSPMLQIGGRNLDGTRNDDGAGIGLSGRVSYEGKRSKINIAAGSVNHLMVADAAYNIRKGFKFNAGINRFMEDGMYGYRRPRLAAELVDSHQIGNVPFLSAVKFRTSAGAYQDNPQLINLNPQYAELFGGTQTSTVFKSALKIQEQLTAVTHPLFNVGNDKWGVKSYIFGGVSARAYSTGDKGALGQIGPILDMRLNRVRLQGNYTQSKVGGSTPFVFDQFIQGQRSCSLFGDIKVTKYLTIGGGLGYNLNNKLFYQKSISAAIGPEDFKVLVSRDMIRGMNRLGFDVLIGSPIPFDKLVLKGAPDHGQLGGI
ncbi:LPS-assembly protein LptD [Candidatus Obscuribacterales bacterium]|nr:LPS-assembly protein LptD [Candidatus Obscuribacterales bacterium]MBX3134653.1 LPS-assembly protein LptD [Candidatus Obscuribacterales bacterium]MBX3149962.1 LPS-assembly protein LptD [Candidatus Obscuribacterales bacterium]